MTQSYEVYVGNLPSDVSIETLHGLFSQVGQVLSIWINQKYKLITYGFIKFGDVNAANEACERFNNRELNFSKIKVKMSFENGKRQKSILLDLPKKVGCSKNHTLKKILVQNLRKNPEIVKDFHNACKEAQNIDFPNQCEIITNYCEQPNLLTLEQTIIRNFKTPRQKNPVPVDFDLTKDKVMLTKQFDKYFNLTLTTVRPIVLPTEKKKKPFALDYRSVVD